MYLARALAAVLLGSPLIWLAGCTTTTDGDGVPAAVTLPPVATAPPGVDKPAQPFDIVQGGNVALIELAQGRIQAKCMAANGYPQFAQGLMSEAVDPFAGLTIWAGSLGATSEEQARRLGFGADSESQPPKIVSSDTNFEHVSDRCATDAWAKMGEQSKETVWAYYDLFDQLARYRLEVAPLLPADLPEKLLSCISGKGYPPPDRDQFLKTPNPKLLKVPVGGLEPLPEDGWTPAMVPGTVELGPAMPARRYVPTPQESQLAVAWFQCQREVRFTELYLAAAATVQRKYLDKYENQIVELNAKVEVLAREAARMVAAS